MVLFFFYWKRTKSWKKKNVTFSYEVGYVCSWIPGALAGCERATNSCKRRTQTDGDVSAERDIPTLRHNQPETRVPTGESSPAALAWRGGRGGAGSTPTPSDSPGPLSTCQRVFQRERLPTTNVSKRGAPH